MLFSEDHRVVGEGTPAEILADHDRLCWPSTWSTSTPTATADRSTPTSTVSTTTPSHVEPRGPLLRTRGMKKLALVVATLASLLVPVAAQAHPLGNFTVNRYSRVELAGRQVDVLYVLDMAEIPTYRERLLIGREGQARGPSDTIARIERGVTLQVDGRRATLTPLKRQSCVSPRRRRAADAAARDRVRRAGPGEGRLGRVVELPRPGLRRPVGWQEVVVQPAAGAQVVRSSVPARSVTGNSGRTRRASCRRRSRSARRPPRSRRAATSARRRPCSRRPTSTGPPRSTPARTRASRS